MIEKLTLTYIFSKYKLKPTEKLILQYIYSLKKTQNSLHFSINQISKDLHISRSLIHTTSYGLADKDLIDVYKFSYVVEILPKENITLL